MVKILTSDTTWSAGSLVILDSDIQVAPGVTLTIEAGVEVEGNNHKIQTFGTLSAVGQNGSDIIFRNTNFTLSTNFRNPGQMTIDHAVLLEGSFLHPTGNGSYGSWSLTRSVLLGVPYIYVWYPTGDVLVQDNYFESCGGISVGTRDNVTVKIDYNTMVNWSGAAVENWASYHSSRTVVTNNNFMNAGLTALQLPPGYSNAAMTASGNYFGTSDISVVASMIFDRSKDLNSAGFISNTGIMALPVGGSLSVPDLLVGSDSGVFISDNITNIATPAFSGTAEPNSTIVLFDGVVSIGAGKVDSSGNWEIKAAALEDGEHMIRATGSNEAGRGSFMSGSLALTIDTMPPGVSEFLCARLGQSHPPLGERL